MTTIEPLATYWPALKAAQPLARQPRGLGAPVVDRLFDPVLDLQLCARFHRFFFTFPTVLQGLLLSSRTSSRGDSSDRGSTRARGYRQVMIH